MQPKNILMVLFVLSIMLTLAACQGENDIRLPDDQQAVTSPVEPGDNLAGGLELPKPSTLPRGTSTSTSDDDRLCLGHERDSTLPFHNVAGSLFAPEFAGAADRTLDHTAYAMYRFENMHAYEGAARLEMAWKDTADTAVDFYAGLANFENDTWKWYKIPAGGSVNLAGGFGPYLNQVGEAIVTVITLDNGLFELDYVLLGDPTSPVMQVTNDLDPNPLLNIAPRVVSFDASASRSYGGTIVDFDFDWEGDGTYDEEGDADGLFIHQYPAGNYQATIRATDNGGRQSVAVIDFAVIDPNNQPPVASFTRNPANGVAPLTVQLDASGSSDPDGEIVLYEWDIQLDGTYDIVSESPLATCVLAIADANSIRLRVTDNFFATAITTLSVNINAGWRSNLVNSAAEIRYQLSTCTNDSGTGERACLAYYSYADDKLRFTRALNADSTAWSIAVNPVNSASPHGTSPSIAVLPNEIPIICFGYAGSGGFLPNVVRATDPTGAAWEQRNVVDGGNFVGTRCSLAIINSFPCIAGYFGGGAPGTNAVLFYQAQNVNGTEWNFPLVAMDPAPGNDYSAVTLGKGSSGLFKRPIIAAGINTSLAPSGLRIQGASNIDGTAWEAPANYAHWYQYGRILDVNGQPAFCGSGIAGTQGTSFVRSLDGNGTAWPADAQRLSETSLACDMAIFLGKPFVVMQEAQGKIVAIEALDEDGNSWRAPYLIGTGASLFSYSISATVVNNEPVVCYQQGTSDESTIRCLSYY
jgi:hypothetical protein